MSDQKKEIGRYIEYHRKRVNWTQPQLAEKAGVSLITVVRMENATDYVGEKAYQSVADALGIAIPRGTIFPSQFRHEDNSL